ncbi:hypothetical protein J6590_033581 [Homalodisca vitripennis]|nr:hypothetical protein J6590_033581 [Homalodisca vitripennis]
MTKRKGQSPNFFGTHRTEVVAPFQRSTSIQVFPNLKFFYLGSVAHQDIFSGVSGTPEPPDRGPVVPFRSSRSVCVSEPPTLPGNF